MTQPQGGRIAVVLDVDGVVAPISGRSEWDDDVTAGMILGSPVRVSPSLCQHLDELSSHPCVECLWLTSWTEPMRLSMDPFPGRDWPAIADPEDRSNYSGTTSLLFAGERWWKWEALNRWLAQRPDVTGIIWCDDHLHGPDATWLFHDVVLTELTRRRLPSLLVSPKTGVGLTPPQMAQIRTWLESQADE